MAAYLNVHLLLLSSRVSRENHPYNLLYVNLTSAEGIFVSAPLIGSDTWDSLNPCLYTGCSNKE